MPIPNFDAKFNAATLTTPQQLLAQRLTATQLRTPPQRLVMCLQTAPLKHLQRQFRGKPLQGFSGQHALLKKTNASVAIAGGFGIGAPAAAAVLHEYAAWGITDCICIGVAGGLQPHDQSGAVVVITSAIRDEGTSYHYLPASDAPVVADANLQRRLQTALATANINYTQGQSWTTDAPYRETQAEIAHYQAANVRCVEMEAAALYAVGKALNVAVTCVVVIADKVTTSGWQLQVNPNVPNTLRTLATLAVTA